MSNRIIWFIHVASPLRDSPQVRDSRPVLPLPFPAATFRHRRPVGCRCGGIPGRRQVRHDVIETHSDVKEPGLPYKRRPAMWMAETANQSAKTAVAASKTAKLPAANRLTHWGGFHTLGKHVLCLAVTLETQCLLAWLSQKLRLTSMFGL